MADKNDDIADEVNRLKGNPNSQLSDFYVSRRDEEEKETPEESGPVQKVTDEKGGARRDSFFKRRDYE